MERDNTSLISLMVAKTLLALISANPFDFYETIENYNQFSGNRKAVVM